jgi:hypothetical protein
MLDFARVAYNKICQKNNIQFPIKFVEEGFGRQKNSKNYEKKLYAWPTLYEVQSYTKMQKII